MLILDVEYEEKRFTLCSIYGPNKDSPGFYRNLFSEIDAVNNDNYIICGDFNARLGAITGDSTNARTKAFTTFMDENALTVMANKDEIAK